MRLVYFGTSEFAVPALEELAEHVVLVVTQPDRPAGRGRQPRQSPVKAAANRLGLSVEDPAKSRDPAFISRIAALDADALVVASYGQILSEALLGAAKRGGINLHASILPHFRGAAPIQRAILEGEPETGVTLMKMDRGMDTGDVIAVQTTPIGPDETSGELEARLAEIGAQMVKEWLPRIAAGTYPRAPQEHAQATLAPKMSKEDGAVSFEMTADAAYLRFRACTPRPGCSVITKLGSLKLIRCESSSLSVAQGAVAGLEDGGLPVGFGGGCLLLKSVQLEGRKAMTGAEFANGARLSAGDSLSPES